MAKIERILITGAAGQIGTDLTLALCDRFGSDNVVITDIKRPCAKTAAAFEVLDVTDRDAVTALVAKHRVDTIFHLAAILSAKGERDPDLCWRVNTQGLYNVLETAREQGLRRIICPSSIAAFGPETPRVNTPQETVLRPRTMYGVTKVTGELLGNYYTRRFGVDVRGTRYPGVISSDVIPSGGTTDYAVEMFYGAIQLGEYTSFLSADTVLPMLYMPDLVEGTLALAEADASRLRYHADYNIAGFSLSPRALADEIRRHLPEFRVSYEPDERQRFADTWPESIDDHAARADWGWNPRFDLPSMVTDMLDKVRRKLA
jgi:threonine 3-dehydrogenase